MTIPSLKVKWLFLLLPFTAYSQEATKLSLDNAIAIALENNPDILSAQKQIDAAEGRILQAGRIPNPEFELSWSEVPTNFNLGDADQTEISVRQMVEFPTRRSRRIEVAEHEQRTSEFELERVKALVSSSVKQAYYRAALNQKLVANFQEVIALLEQFRDMATTRYEAQMVPFLEILRSKVEIAKMTNQLIEARQLLQNDIARLNRLLGRSGSAPVVLSDELTYIPWGRTLAEMADSLQAKTVALKIASSGVARQRTASSLARTSYLPDFSLGLGYLRVREQPPFNANNFTGTTENALGVSLGVSVPLWFWQGSRGEVREADANVQIAEINYSAARRNVLTAIESAFRLVQAAESQVRVYEDALLRDVQDELQSGITLYRNNRIDALNLIDIFRTYTETRAEYYRAVYNFNVALAVLSVAGEETTIP